MCCRTEVTRRCLCKRGARFSRVDRHMRLALASGVFEKVGLGRRERGAGAARRGRMVSRHCWGCNAYRYSNGLLKLVDVHRLGVTLWPC